MKRSLLFSLIAVVAAVVWFFLAAAKASPTLPAIIVLALILFASIALRFYLVFKAMQDE